jgi:SMC interacting uncharacterized protein involved in chromosome segregation
VFTDYALCKKNLSFFLSDKFEFSITFFFYSDEELTGQYEELEMTLNELGEQLANEGERKQAANARVQELEVEVMSVGNSLRSMESGNAEIGNLFNVSFYLSLTLIFFVAN